MKKITLILSANCSDETNISEIEESINSEDFLSSLNEIYGDIYTNFKVTLKLENV